MVEEIKYALNRFENALRAQWQTDGILGEMRDDDYSRISKLEYKYRKFEQDTEAARQNLLEVINKHTCKDTSNSTLSSG